MTTTPALASEIREATHQLALQGGHKLLHLVLDAIQTVDPAVLRDIERRVKPHRPQMLLTLLTWCYATGFYGSQDIVFATGHEGTIRYICSRMAPGWQLLRRFRREHRSLLAQTLAWVLKQAWALKLEDGETSFRSYEWFENDLTAQIEREVRARLELAAIMDGAGSE